MSTPPARPVRPPIRLRVEGKQQLSPHFVRLVLGGPDFASYVDNGFTDRYVKLVFPAPSADPAPNGAATGAAGADGPPVRLRTYTVRQYDPDARQITIDFVIHGDQSDPDSLQGIAAPWAVRAEIGDELTMRGPGGAYVPDADVDAHLLIGDESALPAIASALETMPPGARVRALIEIESEADRQEFVTDADLELSWLERVSPGYVEGDSFCDAVRAIEVLPGRVQAFIHGELGAIRTLRPHFQKVWQIEPDLLSMSGYWRRGKTEEGFQEEKRELGG